MINFTRKPRYGYEDLLEIIRLLRSPEGCPWDRVQTHRSIRRGMLEEAYEAAEAIDTDNAALLKEELGDVLMQVVFHAGIETDAGRFDMDDVCDGVVKKLLYRHPHVFGGVDAQDSDKALSTWEEQKKAEKDLREIIVVPANATHRAIYLLVVSIVWECHSSMNEEFKMTSKGESVIYAFMELQEPSEVDAMYAIMDESVHAYLEQLHSTVPVEVLLESHFVEVTIASLSNN